MGNSIFSRYHKYIQKDDVYMYFEFAFETSKFDIAFMPIDNCPLR